ncbi:hypothetical protein [Bradyrhizobium neotropicale]|uniref:hypothetical protein n=1 Tax=Bradyrhizobium neotropicale TaxID=1497615 RepID=UPI001AD62A01|nr:hypothetical protein [Bradyrhizobium neotropicale]MBO4221939.1 hypothetical protein [Bradyrhizobium neotropicale]
MAVVNITTYNDADFYRTFVWQTAAGAAIDLTGGSMEMKLRRRAEDVTAELRLATDTGEIVFTNPVAGQFTVRITQDVLERLGLGDFDQSNIFTRSGNKVRVWSGMLTNNAGATR